MTQEMMRIDLHCHSEASSDCITPLELFPSRLREQRIVVQAVTDHNEIWGAQKLQELVAELDVESDHHPLQIIVGEEISTTEGELIGLFLEEVVPAGLSPEETVELIQDQGGLVLLPHGFDPLKRYRLQPPALARIADDVDIVESFNARVSQRSWNTAAVEWAAERNVPMSAGSDAHTLSDIGTAWTEVPYQRILTPQDLLNVLEQAEPTGRWRHPVLAFIYKMWDKLRSRIRYRKVKTYVKPTE